MRFVRPNASGASGLSLTQLLPFAGFFFWYLDLGYSFSTSQRLVVDMSDFITFRAVEINSCPCKNDCKAEFQWDAGYTECRCGRIGWLAADGDLYNNPEPAQEATNRFKTLKGL
jgi:hypothetical protein